MDLSQLALQTNGKLFFKFQFRFKLLVENQQIFKPREIVRSAMFYILMDMT